MKGIPDRVIDSLVAPVLRKHQIPEWAGSYIRDYIKANVKRDPIGTVKRGISFIETGRNKGAVTRTYVKLPNGTTFDIAAVARILSLFLYGEERIAEIEAGWASERGAPEYAAHFQRASENSAKHARAIKNALAGIGKRQVEPSREVLAVFDYVQALRNPDERMVVTEIIMRYSYSVFGIVFYRSFYASSAEFMRSFGKAFKKGEEVELWTQKARSILAEGRIPEPRVYELAVGTLSRILASIKSESKMAKEAGIETEAALLRDISIAYPLHIIRDSMPGFDIELCLRRIRESGSAKAEA